MLYVEKKLFIFKLMQKGHGRAQGGSRRQFDEVFGMPLAGVQSQNASPRVSAGRVSAETLSAERGT
jgi:hypothetical protein